MSCIVFIFLCSYVGVLCRNDISANTSSLIMHDARYPNRTKLQILSAPDFEVIFCFPPNVSHTNRVKPTQLSYTQGITNDLVNEGTFPSVNGQKLIYLLSVET